MSLQSTGPEQLATRLQAPFPPSDIEWRIGRAGVKDGKPWASCLAYVTNRAIMDRLDQVVGPTNWKNELREWGMGSPGVLCGLSIKVGDEWVTKWDGADQPDTEPVKGGFSNATKRAAVLWGIARYLYDLPEGWAVIDEKGRYYQAARTDKKTGTTVPAFRWNPPTLPSWALPTADGQATPDTGAAADEPTPDQHATLSELLAAPGMWSQGAKETIAEKALRCATREQFDLLLAQVRAKMAKAASRKMGQAVAANGGD